MELSLTQGDYLLVRMNKPQLHFLHGNSFPGMTYKAMLDLLSNDYRIGVSDRLGHDPAFPVTDGWPHLIEEVRQTLVRQYQEPVLLLGHSLGGLLSLMVAQKHPELVRGLVVIDSPLVCGWRALIWRTIKLFKLEMKVSPARFAQKRKFEWADLATARQHFAIKELFAIWPPEVLDDYMQAGIESVENGVRLRFDRDVEAAIYNTMPHTMGRLLRRPPPVPMGFVGGTDSWECRQAGDKGTKQLMGENMRYVRGSHLIPLEAPELTAAAVLQMLNSVHLAART